MELKGKMCRGWKFRNMVMRPFRFLQSNW